MLEKLWTIVTQNGPSQSDSNKVSVTAHTNTSNNNDFFESSSERKNSAQAELTKPQIKPSTLTSERNVRESLNFSKLQAEDRVEREVIAGLGQQNIAVKNKFTGSGVDYPSDKMTIVKGKDHIVSMQRNEAKTDENRRAVAVVPGLKRRAPQGIGSLTSLSNVCSVSNTGCDYTPKSLITPSTSLSTVNKRARGCYGGLKSETPKSSTPGRIFKTGLAKQTLSNNMQCTLLGCNNRQMSLGVGHSESVTVNQPCKPSNIEPKAVTTPSLRIPVNKSSLTDKQQQKQVMRKDNLMKTLSATTAKNYPMHLNKTFTTPMGKPKPFTPPTKPNSPATPPTVCFNGGGVTPPLCQCGRRTRRRSVVNPGPNQGRAFFACSLNHGRSGLGANANNKKSKSGCVFFRWEIHL